MPEEYLFKIDKNFRSGKKAGKKIIIDISYGAHISYALERNDAGQTVVVKNKTIMAVESFEGKYETIKRGSSLSNGKSCVVIMNKLSVSDKDRVVVNAELLNLLADNKVEALALEENIFIENIENFKKQAAKQKIILLSFSKDDVLNLMGKGN